jgi:CRISPR-associated endonuclease/helicase Cas3
VSTQVVEAGVDVDFPLVLRALAPFDSIVQAGGRCNREGKLSRGRVVLFWTEGNRLPADYLTATSITKAMLTDGPVDFDDPSAAARFFRDLYRNKDLDVKRIGEKQRSLAYETVARDFQMIKDSKQPVLVPFDEDARRLIADLEHEAMRAEVSGRGRPLARRLQPYVVGLQPLELERARREGSVRDSVVPIWVGPYDEVRGLGAALQEDEEQGGLG